MHCSEGKCLASFCRCRRFHMILVDSNYFSWLSKPSRAWLPLSSLPCFPAYNLCPLTPPPSALCSYRTIRYGLSPWLVPMLGTAPSQHLQNASSFFYHIQSEDATFLRCLWLSGIGQLYPLNHSTNSSCLPLTGSLCWILNCVCTTGLIQLEKWI